MASRSDRTLRLIDTETGEITEQACPNCQSKQYALDQLTRKYHGTLSEIGRLKADREQEAREHDFWPRALRLFDIHREATGHLNCDWTSERFWACVPALKKFDDYWIERAIAGIAFDPFTKRSRNGQMQRFDTWETLFTRVANIEVYANRAPADFEPAPVRHSSELAQDIAAFVLDRARVIEETDDAVELARIFIEMDRRVREWMGK